MILTETPLQGAYLIEIEPIRDERGFFARMFCQDQFADRKIVSTVAQCSTSFSARRATLRGMHYQTPPHGEEKFVRCTAGAIYDVIVDIRPASSTYGKWWGAELSGGNRRTLYIPRGFAHGFVTLEDDTEVFYMISTPYAASAARGLRWNDPAIGISWPIMPLIVSSRDQQWPMIRPMEPRTERFDE